MAKIKRIKEGNELIYPLTNINGIVDDEGNRVNFVDSENITSIVTITEDQYNQKLSNGTLSDTTIYFIL